MEGELNTQPAPVRWWREAPAALLVVLVVAIYFTRLTDLTIRGEEPRRAEVAREIVRTGDWIVPRQQGTTYLSRPPLGSWPIALLTLAAGDCPLWVVRLPTVLATLATTLLVYAYSRNFLTMLGAFAAAAAYATMGQVLGIGRLAETEATVTLLIASSLLVWHGGYARGWSASLTWSAGYALAATAGLAKGPQGPVYFGAATWCYLLLVRRDYGYFFRPAHLVGVGAFAAVLCAWQIPYTLSAGLEASWRIWTNNAVERFVDPGLGRWAAHLAGFPVIVLVCMMPWSFLLLSYAWPAFRKTLGDARPMVGFLVTAILVTFPSCWFAVEARPRYFMPLYPCFAPLMGLVVDRCAAAPRATRLFGLWGDFLLLMGVAAPVVAVTVLAGSLPLAGDLPWRQPFWFAVVYAAVAVALGWATLWARRASGVTRAMVGTIAVAAFLGLTYTGVVTNAQVRISENTAAAVARVKSQLRQPEKLVSLGLVNHCFRFHYHDPIELVAWPQAEDELDTAIEYFCFEQIDNKPFELPFAWQELAVVSCDRNRNPDPIFKIHIGRRLPSPTVATRKDEELDTRR